MSKIVSLDDAGNAFTTSLQIADGVGRPHATVIKLVRENASDLNEFCTSGFEIQKCQTAGRPTEVAILNEQQATLLLTYMRNNDAVRLFKKRLVKAFFEMAQQVRAQGQQVQNLSRMEILKLAVQSEEERLRLKQELEEEKPRIAFAKQVEAAPDAISVSEAAKILGTGRRRLFSYLRQIGWVNRRNEPYQDRIEAGHMDVKLGSWEHPDHGLKQSVTPMITGRGLYRLQRMRGIGPQDAASLPLAMGQ